tara:strand:+ start:4350 stop:5159 length:810 start_codon:yes stop_codon:yes gene_type:complete
MSEIVRFKTQSRTASQILQDVVFVTIGRELKVRFGSSFSSIIWLLMEPVSYVLTFWALFSLTGRTSISGVSIPEFILTGALPFMYLRLSITKCMEAVRSNKALLSYKGVTPFTCFLSRFLTETFIAIFATIVLILAVYVCLGELSLQFSAQSFLTVAGYIVFVGLMSLLMMCLSHLYHPVTRIVPPLNRVLFFMSGVFYTSAMLPDKADAILQYNPIFVWIEKLRDSTIRGFESDINVTYLPYLIMLSVTAIVFIFKREHNRKLLDATV